MASGSCSGKPMPWEPLPVGAADAPRFADLIFAGMRAGLLDLREQGPRIAFALEADANPIGLIYGEIEDSRTGHVRSIFVKPEHRRRGAAGALLRAIENEFRIRGCSEMRIAYVTGKPSTEAVEKLLRAAGWNDPQPDTLFCRVDERMANWWAYRKQNWLTEDFTLFDWTDLTAADREHILRTQAESPWIPEDLVPFQYEQNLEPLNSFGLRFKGEVAGWMITHRLDRDTIRYTCSFMRGDLQKRFRIAPIYQEAYRRQSEAGIPYALFMVPYRHPAMVNFTKRHWVGKFATAYESRTCSRPLAAPLAEAVLKVQTHAI